MTEVEAQAAGRALTEQLRRYFSIGPRTRRYRGGTDLHNDMAEAVCLAAQYRGVLLRAGAIGVSRRLCGGPVVLQAHPRIPGPGDGDRAC